MITDNTPYHQAIAASVYQHMDDDELEDFYLQNKTYLDKSTSNEAKPITTEIELERPFPVMTSNYVQKEMTAKQPIIIQKLDQPMYKFPHELIQSLESRSARYYCYAPDFDNNCLHALYDYYFSIQEPKETFYGAEGLIKVMNLLENYSVVDRNNRAIDKLSDVLSKEEIEVSANIDVQLPYLFSKDDLLRSMNVVDLISAIRIKSMMEFCKQQSHTDQYSSLTVNTHVSCRILGLTYYYDVKFNNLQFKMMLNPKYLCIATEDFVCVGFSECMNYLVTLAETSMNIEILLSSTEFSDSHLFLASVKQLAMSEQVSYGRKVSLISSIESISLYMMDLLSSSKCSHICLLDSLGSWADFYDVDVYEMWRFLIGRPLREYNDNGWSKLFYNWSCVNVHNLGSISSIHKFYAISEIDYVAGWTKYHNRTARRYDTDKTQMRRLILLARKEFTEGYSSQNKSLPSFKYSNSQTEDLKRSFNVEGLNCFERYQDLEFWEKVIPYACLEKMQFDDITPNLKDTACTVKYYNANKSSSTKELTDYLNRADSKVDGIRSTVTSIKMHKLHGHRMHLVTNDPAQVNEFISKCSKDHTDAVVRLVGKEKEQKPEGRYFGIASFDLKLGLSKLMTTVKKAVKYFKDQIMTLNDYQRKVLLFDAAQKLRDKDVYSIMIDISGHNQSMTVENCKPLLEFILGLYGCEEDAIAAELFENIIVVQENTQNRTYYVSSGQSGAIEGWMNQLWGLQSALIMRLFCYDRSIDVEHILTYSDDIDLIMRSKSNNFEQLVTLFLQAQEFYMKFGQLVKIKQTQLSPTRLTMLKNHFINGVLSHTIIKRLLTMTMFSSKQYYCEQQESESISSTCASAMEGALQIITALKFKHLYLLMMGYYTFTNYFRKGLFDKASNAFREHVDPRFIVLYKSRQSIDVKHASIFEHNHKKSYTVQFKEDKESYDVNIENEDPSSIRIRKNGGEWFDSSNEEVFNELTDALSYNVYKLKSDYDLLGWFLELMAASSKMRLLWVMRIYSPINVGGLGVMPLLQLAISGHSESKVKNINWLTLYAHKLNCYTQEFRHWLYCNYSIQEGVNEEEKYESLISNLFPVYETMSTHKDMIKKIIINYLLDTNNYRNKDIKRYATYYLRRSEFYHQVISLVKEQFYYRVARKYVDMSHVALLEMFISKLEHSQTILRYINPDMRSLISNIFRTSTHSYTKLFQRLNLKLPFDINELNVENNLLMLKKHNFPSIRIKDILEPSYDFMLVEQPFSDMLMVQYGPKTIFKDGMQVYPRLAYSGSVRPKYQLKQEMDIQFSNPAEYRVFELVRYTKWVTEASKAYARKPSELDSNNYINLCNYVLSYYTPLRYKDIQGCVLTPTGGELFHRTDNQGFKSSSAVRICPNRSGSINIVINPSFVDITGGYDSNVNYDYMMNRLTAIALIKELYSGQSVSYGYSLRTDYKLSTQDVRCIIAYAQKEVKSEDQPDQLVEGITDLGTQKFTLISELLASGLDISSIDFAVAKLDAKMPGITGIVKMIYTVKHVVMAYLSQSEAFRLDQIPNHIWEAFVTQKIDPIEYSNAFDEPLTVTNLQARVEAMIADENKKLVVYRGNTEKLIQNWIIARTEADYRRLNWLMSHNGYKSTVGRTKKICKLLLRLLLLREYIIYSYSRDENNGILLKLDIENTKHVFMRSLMHCKNNPWLNISKDPLFVDFLTIYEERIIRRCLSNVVNCLDSEVNNMIIMGVPCEFSAIADIARNIFTLKYVESETKIDSDVINLNVNELLGMNKINGAVKWYEHTVKAHCALDAYNSPTGSQSYIPQVSVFDALIREGLISRDDKVIDLCAGRGDGHWALKSCNLEHISVSRGDDYDLFNCAEDIHYDDKLNIFDFQTVKKYLGGDVCHLDITFMKDKGDSNIWDTITNLLSNNKKVTVRANWIQDVPTEDHMKVLRRSDVRLILGARSRVTYYHVYLYFEYKDEEIATDNDIDYREGTILRTLTNRVLEYKKYSVFDVATEQDITTEIGFLCSPELIEQKANELLKQGGKRATLFEMDSVVGTCIKFMKGLKELKLFIPEINHNEPLKSWEFWGLLFNDSWVNYQACSANLKVLRHMYNLGLVCKEDSLIGISLKSMNLIQKFTELSLVEPNNYSVEDYMMDILLCVGKTKYGDKNIIRSAYSIIRRYFSDDRKGSKLCEDKLFHFRLLANKITRWPGLQGGKWEDFLEVKKLGIKDYQLGDDEELDPVKPGYFMEESMVNKLMAMFGFSSPKDVEGPTINITGESGVERSGIVSLVTEFFVMPEIEKTEEAEQQWLEDYYDYEYEGQYGEGDLDGVELGGEPGEEEDLEAGNLEYDDDNDNIDE